MLVGGVVMCFVLYQRTRGDQAQGWAIHILPTFQIVICLNWSNMSAYCGQDSKSKTSITPSSWNLGTQSASTPTMSYWSPPPSLIFERFSELPEAPMKFRCTPVSL